MLSKGTVKSVQRGTYESTGSASNITEDIQIAQVNAEKCLLALDVFTAARTSSFVGYHSATLSNDKITVTFRSPGVDYLAQWQVIEFY